MLHKESVFEMGESERERKIEGRGELPSEVVTIGTYKCGKTCQWVKHLLCKHEDCVWTARTNITSDVIRLFFNIIVLTMK